MVQLSSKLLVTEGVKASAEYRFKYRAQNFNGWGPESDISYYIAATIPNRPPTPIYVSSSASSTTLQFLEPEILGGSPLTAFKLYVDTLQETADYTLIYEGIATSYTVTDTVDSLTTGVIYRYVLVATNVFGDSP